jgi:uncharacterized protein (TIGR03437 family)
MERQRPAFDAGRGMTAKGILAAAALSLSALSVTGFGQTAPATILTVDIENTVIYLQDAGDAALFATNANIVTVPTLRNFTPTIWIADIVAVNGKPAKGTWTSRGTQLFRATTVNPGNAIADSGGAYFIDYVFDLRQVDGTQIGTIMASGWGGSPPPPGAPASFIGANITITGGTGAYLGVRGQGGMGASANTARLTSMTEDPAYRRINGGGVRRYIFHLLPMERPEIVSVWHSDFTPVSAAQPTRAGEVLIASARGLGPTQPGVEPATPFPPAPLLAVNSPVEVSVDGAAVELINAIGWPTQDNLYRVDFRMPKSVGSTATLRLTAAWITGPALTIPAQ